MSPLSELHGGFEHRGLHLWGSNRCEPACRCAQTPGLTMSSTSKDIEWRRPT